MNNSIGPVFRIGMTAAEVVAEIVRVNPEIAKLSFYVYAPKYNVKELHESKRQDLVFPGLFFHDPTRETLRRNRDGITVADLKEIIRTLGIGREDSVIGVLSKTRIKRKIFHVPMMDFSLPERPQNLQKIECLLKMIGQKNGVILSSGRSYHYYGLNLMSETEWFDFLGDCLLSGLVDTRYIAHRCKDRCGILRISACPLRPKIPSVVSVIE